MKEAILDHVIREWTERVIDATLTQLADREQHYHADRVSSPCDGADCSQMTWDMDTIEAALRVALQGRK